MNRLIFALACTCILLTRICLAAETVSFSFAGCTDAMNRPVASQADSTLPVLLETRLIEGSRVIFYNPSLLPQLLPETRAFLYAHECAWTRLGLPIDRERSEANAYRADCWAADALQRSKLIKGAESLEAIASDLDMQSGNAAQLPGPARELKLSSCAAGKASGNKAAASKGNVLDVNPSATSPAWNACVLGCGNKLFACGRGTSCQSSFDQCKAACGEK